MSICCTHILNSSVDNYYISLPLWAHWCHCSNEADATARRLTALLCRNNKSRYCFRSFSGKDLGQDRLELLSTDFLLECQ